MMSTTTVRSTTEAGAQRWIGGFGVLLSAVAFGVVAGPIGLLLGVALIGAWYWFPAIVGFAFGHTALLLIPQSLPVLFLLAVEVGLGCLLVSSVMGENEFWRIGIVLSLLIVFLEVFAWFGQELFDTFWPVALVLTATVTVVAYGFHRYEQLKINLMEEA